MMRVVVGVAAWVAGTAIAVSVAWFGANVVLADAGVGQGVPVVNAAPSTPPAATPTPPAGAGAGTVAPSGSAAAGGAARSSPSPQPAAAGGTGPGTSAGSASVSPASTPVTSAASSASATSTTDGVHDYQLTGGRVTLDMTAGSVQLVSAVPDAGYAVQTWSGTGWLRVDFSSGPQVSSLIASWYQHAPSVTVEN
jgi:hypothetical protein